MYCVYIHMRLVRSGYFNVTNRLANFIYLYRCIIEPSLYHASVPGGPSGSIVHTAPSPHGRYRRGQSRGIRHV